MPNKNWIEIRKLRFGAETSDYIHSIWNQFTVSKKIRYKSPEIRVTRHAQMTETQCLKGKYEAHHWNDI